MYNDPKQPTNPYSNDQNYPFYQNTNTGNTSTNPTIPGQLGYPPPPPVRPQKPHKKAWGWYKRQKNGTKLGVGCLSIFVLLMVCALCSGLSSMAAAGTHNAARTTTASKTTSQQVVQKVVPTVKPTPKPTVKPTPKPTMKPTAIPTPIPTPVPTLIPTPMPAPRPIPTALPAPIPVVPTPTPVPVITGVNGNPWGYNFNGGSYIYSPPANFCSYFTCIASFWKSTNGYVDECNDGTYSHSGGRSGDCSYHGGELRALFAQ